MVLVGFFQSVNMLSSSFQEPLSSELTSHFPFSWNNLVFFSRSNWWTLEKRVFSVIFSFKIEWSIIISYDAVVLTQETLSRECFGSLHAFWLHENIVNSWEKRTKEQRQGGRRDLIWKIKVFIPIGIKRMLLIIQLEGVVIGIGKCPYATVKLVLLGENRNSCYLWLISDHIREADYQRKKEDKIYITIKRQTHSSKTLACMSFLTYLSTSSTLISSTFRQY